MRHRTKAVFVCPQHQFANPVPCMNCGRPLCPTCFIIQVCHACVPLLVQMQHIQEAPVKRKFDGPLPPPQKKRKLVEREDEDTEIHEDQPTFAQLLLDIQPNPQNPHDPHDPLNILHRVQKAQGERMKGSSRRSKYGRGRSLSMPQFLFAREIGNEVRIRHDDLYAYVHKIERLGPDTYVVVFECTTVKWMRNAWSELVANGSALVLNSILFNGLFRKDFVAGYEALKSPERRFLFALYVWFLDRVLAEGDEAPVAYWDLTLSAKMLETSGIVESNWYTMTLSDNDLAGMASGEWQVHEVDAARDPGPERRWLVRDAIDPVAAVSEDHPLDLNQQALLMLHFPRSEPPPEPFQLSWNEDLPLVQQQQNNLGGQFLFRIREEIAALGSRAAEAFDALRRSIRGELARVFDGAMTPALAGAGALGGVIGVAPEEVSPAARPQPMAYVGGNAGVGAPGAQPPNPMVRGAHPHDQQPFLGSIDIGQGNCSALFDNQGQAIVYYDVGYRKVGDEPLRGKPTLCLCHQPLIVLSHWDVDHITLARHNSKIFRLNWIVPRQHMGTGETRDIVSQIIQRGGRLYLWEDRQGCMTFPWGFLVRIDRGVEEFSKKDKNDTGIALYVCVKDAAGNTVAPNNPQPCAHINLRAQARGAIATALHNNTGQTMTVTSVTKDLEKGECAHEAVKAVTYAAGQGATEEVKAIVACLAVQLFHENVNPRTKANIYTVAQAVWAARDDAGTYADPVNAMNAAARQVLRMIASKGYGHGTLKACVEQWIKNLPGKAKISATFFPSLMETAGAMPVPAALAPLIQDVDAGGTFPPTLAGERFLMSTGDGALQFVPPQRFDDPPVVVGFSAFHHGSNVSDGAALLASSVPWAFNSGVARAVAALNAAAAADSDVEIARAVAVALGGVDAIRAVDAFRAQMAVDPGKATIYAAAKQFHPALTWGPALLVIDQAVAMAGDNTKVAADVLNAVGGGVDAARTALANAALTWNRTAAGAVAGAIANLAVQPEALRALKATVPLHRDGELSDGAFDLTIDDLLTRTTTARNAAVPSQDRASAAFHAASGNVSTAAQQEAFVAAIYASVAANGAKAVLPNLSQALAREDDPSRTAIAVAMAAVAATARVAGVALATTELFAFALLYATSSDAHRAAATRSVAGNATAADRAMYTWGNNNSYHHPMAAGVDKFVAHGWTHPLHRTGRGGADTDFAIGWEEGGGYEGPLRGDDGLGGPVDRGGVCGCNGVKRFEVI